MKRYPTIKNADKLDTSEFRGEVAFEVLALAEKGSEEKPVIERTCVFMWSSVPEQEHMVGKEFVVPFFFGPGCDVSVSQLKRVLRDSGFQTATWEDSADVMIPGALNYLAIQHAVLLGKTTRGGTKGFFNPIRVIRVHPATGEALGDTIPEVIDNADVTAAFNASTTKTEKTPF